MKTINVNSTSEFEEAILSALADGAVVSRVVLSYPQTKRKGVRMKKVVIYLCLLVVLGVVGTLSVQAYNRVRHERQVESSQAAVKAQAAAKQQAKAAAADQVKLYGLKSQCAKDHAAYVALTPAQRNAKGAVTDCDPSLQLVQ